MQALLESLFPSETGKLSESEARTQLTSKAVEVMRSIVAANQENMANYKSNPKVLDAGIYYPNDYYKALKSLNQQKRIDFLIQNGSFWHGFASTSHFKMIPAPKGREYPTGFIGCCFVLKEGVLASDALASLRQKTTLIGCAEVCQIAYYEAIKHLFGDDKFNSLFAANSSTPFMIGQSVKNPIAHLIRAIPAGSKIEFGQSVQFKNAPIYRLKHLNGGGFSFCTLCVDSTPGNEKFTTLGLDAMGLTHNQVNGKLAVLFNDSPVGLKTVTDEVASFVCNEEILFMSKELEDKKFTEAQLKENKLGEIGTRAEIGADRIVKLANTSTEIARILLDGWVGVTKP